MWRSWNHFLGKKSENLQSSLNLSFLLDNILENGFEATISSKSSVLSVFMSDKIETVFWKSEAKCSKLLKFKIGNKKQFRKWFWSYLEVKNKCSESLKMTFFTFCKFLSDNVKTVFWKSEAKHSKLFESKVGHRKFFRKWFCSYLVVKSECSDCLKIAIFSFLYIFQWRSWNRILGKQRKAFKIV